MNIYAEIVVREHDTFDDLKRKVALAVIMGTFQSTLTDFKYIRKQWINNCKEERLLGVSMTGIMDHPVLAGKATGNDPNLANILNELKHHAIEINKQYATLLGIPESAAITTVKPSGTVSQLVDSASGIHPRHNPYYIRTVRADVKDPLAVFMKDVGVPCEADVTNPSNLVFSFPVKAPETAVFRQERSAIEQLEHYLTFKKYWCEHNPSITVYVKEEEWMEVGAWVYKNFDDVGGVSFLPHNDHVYKQAPYQDIDQYTYHKLASEFPNIDWAAFDAYELDDSHMGMKELACVSGYCEVI